MFVCLHVNLCNRPMDDTIVVTLSGRCCELEALIDMDAGRSSSSHLTSHSTLTAFPCFGQKSRIARSERPVSTKYRTDIHYRESCSSIPHRRRSANYTIGVCPALYVRGDL
jgi:hypothetical protein